MPFTSDALSEALATNDHAAAERYAREFIASCGDQPAAWQTLGEAQLNQGRLSDARDSLLRALSLGADGSVLRFELASALEQCGEINDAIEHLRRAVALEPQMSAAQINLAALLEKVDRLDEALAASQRAV
ncbi:MAG TPA: tetratricopeptide repeat protein, partial [Pirellulales bacterium]